MPRPPRIFIPDVAQHARQRGIDGQATFFDDADREFYLRCLAETARWYELSVHAYCLMTNHVHLLVTPDKEYSLWRAMQRLGGQYVRHVNARYGRTGTLWDGRYKACPVDNDDYLLTCQRYIELNPLRAGLVDSPAAYPWSSYRYSALGCSNALVSPHPVYIELGNKARARRAAYRALCEEQLPDETLEEIRRALRHNHVLGNKRFRDQVEAMLGRSVGPGRPGRPRSKRRGGN
jgi:putative transposase